MRAAIERDDSRFREHFVANGDVLRRLRDLVVVVVAGRKWRNAVVQNAAFVQVMVLPRIRWASPLQPLRARGDFSLTLWRKRRNPTVGRIDNERGLLQQIAALPPELVIGARV